MISRFQYEIAVERLSKNDPTLKYLYLSFNQISCFDTLADVLKVNEILEELRISNNQLPDEDKLDLIDELIERNQRNAIAN